MHLTVLEVTMRVGNREEQQHTFILLIIVLEMTMRDENERSTETEL